MKIAVVVPTIRPESFVNFKKKWGDLFKKHKVTLVAVIDGHTPFAEVTDFSNAQIDGETITVSAEDFATYDLDYVMGNYKDLIYNLNDGVRNLGFAIAHKILDVDVIISLDDDTEPFGDTIQDHLDALSKKYPVSWMNTAEGVYMRGFPYKVREEAECVLSHGVWRGVADFDASTQLVLGTPELKYPKMPVPRGVLFPMCIMNVAFKAKMTPYMYQAPMGFQLEVDKNIKGMNRFADIWGGIEAKLDIDRNNWCAVTGYATVKHERASNAFKNLESEAKGIGLNENYGKDYYFSHFKNMRLRWQEFLAS